MARGFSLAFALAIAVVALVWLGSETRDDVAQGAAAQAAEAAQQAPDTLSEAVKTEAPSAVSVIAIHSQAQDLPGALMLRGVTEASRKIDVRAQTSGLVISEPLRKGAHVAKDDILCQIETGDREAQMLEARARLAQAQTSVAASRQLTRKGFAAETKLAADEAALASAEASIRRIELDQARTRITAPFAGVLETDAAEIGSLLQAGSVCASIVSLRPIRLVGFAAEIQVGQIMPGATARARVLGAEPILATVSFVSRAADPDTRTFRIEATAANDDGALRDGMSAELVIPLAPDRAHLAPQAALTLNDEGVIGVRLVAGERAEFTPVKVLRDAANGVWLAGLPDQAEIVIVGQEFITDSSTVRVTYRDMSAE